MYAVTQRCTAAPGRDITHMVFDPGDPWVDPAALECWLEEIVAKQHELDWLRSMRVGKHATVTAVLR